MSTVLHVTGGCGQKGTGQKLCAKCRATLVPGRRLTVWWSKERDPFRGGEEVEVVRWPVCTNGKIEAVLLPDRLNPPVVEEEVDYRDHWPVEYLARLLEEPCPHCDTDVPLVGKRHQYHKLLTSSRRVLCRHHLPPQLYQRADGVWSSRTHPDLLWEDDGTGKPGRPFDPRRK